jgi:hypothetical protein
LKPMRMSARVSRHLVRADAQPERRFSFTSIRANRRAVIVTTSRHKIAIVLVFLVGGMAIVFLVNRYHWYLFFLVTFRASADRRSRTQPGGKRWGREVMAKQAAEETIPQTRPALP